MAESERSDSLVSVVRQDGLKVFYPHYTNIRLITGRRPGKADSKVIFCMAGAFTGECLDKFRHANVAGDHVVDGKRYHGYRCRKNTGAFTYAAGHPRFFYKNYSAALDQAARKGGMGFAQEMIIHEGKEVRHDRSLGNRNIFRALCLVHGKLCVVESQRTINFGDFIEKLKKLGATEALYTDMGRGWNHAWYRPTSNELVYIHSWYNSYSTNWVVFEKE